MLLDLLALGTSARFRLLGGRSWKRQIGDIDFRGYTLGPDDGEPWLLLHGLGSTALSWAPVARDWRGECRMLLPELAELGGTNAPGGALSIGASADALARLIETEFGGRPVNVAGISLGGWMATRLALERPELVSRLALVVAGGYRDQDWAMIEGLVTLHTAADVDRLYQALFFQTPWPMRLARRGFLEAFASPSVTTVLRTTREEDAFGDEELARIACPAAVVWAEHDGLFRLEIGRKIAAALPQSRFYLIERCGHAAHWENPRALIAALRDFRTTAPPLPHARRILDGETGLPGVSGV